MHTRQYFHLTNLKKLNDIFEQSTWIKHATTDVHDPSTETFRFKQHCWEKDYTGEI